MKIMQAWIAVVCLLLCLAVTPVLFAADGAVTIRVDASASEGPMQPIWSFFGYDEPNYTYADHGKGLISELAALSYKPVYIRAHNLLTSGDGTAALKWGSTNAYTEDASGKPVYDWKIVDKIFDTYLQAKAKPFVEFGFMPEALSSQPKPYQHTWPKGKLDTGWAFPPKDYDKWAGLIREFVKHSVERYGKAEVESWYWELWNEPDIFYWHGTPDEYNKLYDYTAKAVKDVLPTAKVGGPATTGPRNPKAAAYLKQFLEHCASGRNYATNGTGAPLDFVSFHAKGAPEVANGRVRMGLSGHLRDFDRGFEIVSSFPQFKKLPLLLTESDPEGCAACSARVSPENAYRNGTLYPTYTAVTIRSVLDLAKRHDMNLAGLLTWAFEFEDQPYFDGFRTLATNGVDKPVLNIFRMAGLLRGDRVKLESSGAVPLDAMLKDGVRSGAAIDGIATRSDHSAAVMVWNYADDEAPGSDAPVRISIAGLPAKASRLLLRHYRIDRDHSNAYTSWKAMGSPQSPTVEQYSQMKAAGQLQLLESPQWIHSNNGSAEVEFSLPRHAVSLVEVSW